MSFHLATKIAQELTKREAQNRRALRAHVDQSMQGRVRSPLRQVGQIETIDGDGGSALAIGLGAGGIIAVLLLFGMSLYFDWLRFRDGTKWERILQVTSMVVALIEIPAVLSKASPGVLAGLELLRAGTDGYAAGHQILRGEHPIANGLALLADAWGLVDTALLTSAAIQGPRLPADQNADVT